MATSRRGYKSFTIGERGTHYRWDTRDGVLEVDSGQWIVIGRIKTFRQAVLAAIRDHNRFYRPRLDTRSPGIPHLLAQAISASQWRDARSGRGEPRRANSTTRRRTSAGVHNRNFWGN